MTRPIVVQLKNTMTPMLSDRLGPNTETRASAQSRNGTLITRSIVRLKTISTQPPKKPARSPTLMPMQAATSAASTPAVSETVVP